MSDVSCVRIVESIGYAPKKFQTLLRKILRREKLDTTHAWVYLAKDGCLGIVIDVPDKRIAVSIFREFRREAKKLI